MAKTTSHRGNARVAPRPGYRNGQGGKEEAVFDPFLKEEAMSRSIVKAITKRFSRKEIPIPEKSSPVSPCPEVNGNSTHDAALRISPLPVVSPCPEVNDNSTPANAFSPGDSPILDTMEIPSAELNGNSTPVNVSIADVSPGVPAMKIPSVELNGNGTPDNASIPDINPSVREDELRLRAYWKWEAAGKPKGSESRFWREAMEELCNGS
jgi:hypothetical protein